MPQSKYKVVIFDFDDTLVESRPFKFAHHKAVAKKFYNIELTDKDISEQWGKPLNTVIDNLYKSSDTIENMHKALISVRDDFLKKEYDGSVETVNTLLENKIKIGVLSATNRKYIEEDLKRLNFPLENFFVIQGADETSVHKPSGKVFDKIFEKLGLLVDGENIKKEEIVYVGDSLDDYMASADAGIDFIGITTGLYSETDFATKGADKIVKSIKEITKHIFEL